jgi:hypothetical protein
MVEPEETAIVRQWHAKTVSTGTHTHTKIEELLEVVFSTQFVLRVYSKDSWCVHRNTYTRKNRRTVGSGVFYTVRAEGI